MDTYIVVGRLFSDTVSIAILCSIQLNEGMIRRSVFTAGGRQGSWAVLRHPKICLEGPLLRPQKYLEIVERRFENRRRDPPPPNTKHEC
jgi:hypothetical protein